MKTGRRGFIVTPETAIRFTETSVFLTCIFAPKRADKLRLFLFRVLMIASVLLTVTFFLSLLLSILENLDKLVVVIKSLTFMSSLVNYVIKVVIVRIYCNNFKRLQWSVKNFIENADKFERKIIQKYVDECWKFQLFVTIGSYFTTTGFLLGPLVLPQKFPTEAVYPFSTENTLVTVIVYLQQSIGGYQAAAAVVLDCQMAVYLWYLCVRFEGLILQMDHVEDHLQLIIEIQDFYLNFQRFLSTCRFVDETIPSIRAVVFSTVTINKFIMICAAVVLISGEGSIEKLQCGVIVIFTALNIYTFIRPADRLIELTSYGMSNKVFNSFWTLNQKMRKTCLLIIHRTQYPVLIRIPGFLETVSNQYYSSVCIFAFKFHKNKI
ncbi:GSCOCT00013803001.3-RA-CDS [Cotesia congregata]|uniref:Odorant receptor n=1 Tax=Cotesia congregata TaxID=51543 RepID=A0A8J2HJA2_COTCN|nr:GSCOCT00013803001.3-RA-CDS [Cotesia congregata]CAG5098044.1 olfactory receptor 63 [Cotesia congregata]